MKLLIADDHVGIRLLLGQLCEASATEIRYCADGADAVDTFQEFQPDWTLMDISMPELDGLAATRQILARHPGARIVVLTEHRGAEYEQAAREAGACAFIRKDDLTLLRQLVFPAPHLTSRPHLP